MAEPDELWADWAELETKWAVATARAERQATVGRYLADLRGRSRPSLRPRRGTPGLGADSDVLTLADCLGTVFDEEEVHLGDATRDLGVLAGRPRISPNE